MVVSQQSSELNSIMCSSVHTAFNSYNVYGDCGAKFHNFNPTPCKFNTNPLFLSSRIIMGLSDNSLLVAKKINNFKSKVRNFMNHRYKFAVYSSNGFDFSPDLNLKEENELGFEFNDEGVDDMRVSSSSKGVKVGNDGIEELGFDEPLKEESKTRVSKGESLMGGEENGRVESSLKREEGGNDMFGGLQFDEPLKKGAKGRFSKGGNLFGEEGVMSCDDDLQLQKDEDDDEEEQEIVRAMPKAKGKVGLKRRRKQLIKRSSLLAKQVIGIQSAVSLGFVSQLWVDTTSWAVVEVEVRPSLLSSESGIVLLGDIQQVGDVVLINEDNFVLNECNTIGLETMVGYSVVTPRRRNLGKVRGYTFNINSGTLESLELDAFGYSIIPSSLVSTYALLTEDVLEVVSDTIIVHEAAVSRIQRLTKGFLGAKDTDRSNNNLEYNDMEPDSLQPNKGGKSRRKRRRQKFSTRKSGFDDDLELPMDYM